MNYIGGITEFNYNPIESFNNSLKDSSAFAVPEKETFEKVFEERMAPERNDMDNFMSKISGAFSDGLHSVNNDALNAERAEQILASGGDISAHEVMIAAEKSNLSLQMAVQIRNRLINAYQEINSMQL